VDEEQDLGPPELHVGFARVQEQQVLPHLPAAGGFQKPELGQEQCCGSGSTGSTCFWASRIQIRIH
jgi:hypothetical protein